MSEMNTDRFGLQPFEEVIELGNLTSHTADPNGKASPERGGQHPQPTPLLAAVQSGDLERLEKELAIYKDQINDTYGSLCVTLLHLAAYDQPHLVQTLISNGANVKALDHIGRSAFHLACTAASSPACIRALIKAGADVNQKIMLPTLTRAGMLPPTSVISPEVEFRKKPVDAMDTEINYTKHQLKFPSTGVGSHIPEPEYLGRTGLHLAVKATSPNCVAVILKAGAYVNPKDQKGFTPLLLAGTGVSPDDTEGLLRYEEVVKMLVAAGADVKAIHPDTGDSALHHAAARCSLSATRLLVEHGASISKISNTGATTLHEAAESGALQVLEYLLKTAEGINLVNRRDHVNRTPLHKAAFSGNRGCLELLLKNGGHLGIQTHSGTSVLDAIFIHVARPYQFLTSIFDRCIKTNGMSVLSRAFQVHLDFSVLSPPNCDKQTSILREIFNSPKGYGQNAMLHHPLLEAFLWLKWQKLRIFFFFLLFIYGSFIVSMSVFVIADIESRDKDATNISRTTRDVAKIFLVITSIILLIHVLMQLILRPMFYLKEIETWNFAFLGSSSLVVALDPGSDKEKLISIVVLTAWTELLLMIGRFPTWGNYALMFYTVLMNVLKVMLTFVFIVIGFTLSFYVQFHDQEIFSDPAKSFIKTVVMMTGEFEYKDLFDVKPEGGAQGHTPLHMGHAIFLMFVILATIVMMNLLVGLAVSDIQELQAEGLVRRLLKQTQFVDHLETIISQSIIFKRCLPKFFLSYFTERRRVVTELTLRSGSIDNNNRSTKKLPRRLIEACVELAVRQKELSQLESNGRTSRILIPEDSQSGPYGLKQQAAVEDMMHRLFEELQDVKNLLQTSSKKSVPASLRGRTLSIKESRRLNQHLKSDVSEQSSKPSLDEIVSEVQGAKYILKRWKMM